MAKSTMGGKAYDYDFNAHRPGKTQGARTHKNIDPEDMDARSQQGRKSKYYYAYNLARDIYSEDILKAFRSIGKQYNDLANSLKLMPNMFDKDGKELRETIRASIESIKEEIKANQKLDKEQQKLQYDSVNDYSKTINQIAKDFGLTAREVMDSLWKQDEFFDNLKDLKPDLAREFGQVSKDLLERRYHIDFDILKEDFEGTEEEFKTYLDSIVSNFQKVSQNELEISYLHNALIKESKRQTMSFKEFRENPTLENAMFLLGKSMDDLATGLLSQGKHQRMRQAFTPLSLLTAPITDFYRESGLQGIVTKGIEKKRQERFEKARYTQQRLESLWTTAESDRFAVETLLKKFVPRGRNEQGDYRSNREYNAFIKEMVEGMKESWEQQSKEERKRYVREKTEKVKSKKDNESLFRQKKPTPNKARTFEEGIYKAWGDSNITLKEALDALNISKTTFYKRIKDNNVKVKKWSWGRKPVVGKKAETLGGKLTGIFKKNPSINDLTQKGQGAFLWLGRYLTKHLGGKSSDEKLSRKDALKKYFGNLFGDFKENFFSNHFFLNMFNDVRKIFKDTRSKPESKGETRKTKVVIPSYNKKSKKKGNLPTINNPFLPEGDGTTKENKKPLIQKRERIFESIDNVLRSIAGKDKNTVTPSIKPSLGDVARAGDVGALLLANILLQGEKGVGEEKKGGLLSGVVDTLKGVLPFVGKIAGLAGVAWGIADGLGAMKKSQEWGVTKGAAFIGGFFAGPDSQKTWKGAFKNMGKWALMGVGIGMTAGGPVGAIIGGLAGAALGGLFYLIGGKNIAKFADGVVKVGKWIWDGVTSVFTSIGTWVKDTVTGAWNWTVKAIGDIGKFFGEGWTWIKTTATSIGDWLGTAVGDAWEFVKQTTKDIINWITSPIQSVVNTFNNLIQPLTEEEKKKYDKLDFFGKTKMIVDEIFNRLNKSVTEFFTQTSMGQFIKNSLIQPIDNFFSKISDTYTYITSGGIAKIPERLKNVIKGSEDVTIYSQKRTKERRDKVADSYIEKYKDLFIGEYKGVYNTFDKGNGDIKDKNRGSLLKFLESKGKLNIEKDITSVEDAIIRSDGKIIRTSPEDNIIATKNKPMLNEAISHTASESVTLNTGSLEKKLDVMITILSKILEKDTTIALPPQTVYDLDRIMKGSML